MASDSFTRANETPLASPWVKQVGSNLNLVSNAVQSAAAGNTLWYYSGATSSADHYSQAQASLVPSRDWAPACRIAGAGHASVAEGYILSPFGSAGSIDKFVNGSFSNIASNVLVSPADGQVLRLEVEGTTLRPYQDGVARNTATDTSLTVNGNGPGLFVYEPGGAIDNWSGANLAAEVIPDLTMAPMRR